MRWVETASSLCPRYDPEGGADGLSNGGGKHFPSSAGLVIGPHGAPAP